MYWAVSLALKTTTCSTWLTKCPDSHHCVCIILCHVLRLTSKLSTCWPTFCPLDIFMTVMWIASLVTYVFSPCLIDLLLYRFKYLLHLLCGATELHLKGLCVRSLVFPPCSQHSSCIRGTNCRWGPARLLTDVQTFHRGSVTADFSITTGSAEVNVSLLFVHLIKIFAYFKLLNFWSHMQIHSQPGLRDWDSHPAFCPHSVASLLPELNITHIQ